MKINLACNYIIKKNQQYTGCIKNEIPFEYKFKTLHKNIGIWQVIYHLKALPST